jgi:heme-degrading monooxygenase HmoA
LFARIVRYQVPTTLFDEALAGFAEAAKEIEQLVGFEHGYVLGDRESGLIMTTTFWENRAALDSSDVRAGALRQRAIGGAEGSVESVDRVEVVTEIGAHTRV